MMKEGIDLEVLVRKEGKRIEAAGDILLIYSMGIFDTPPRIHEMVLLEKGPYRPHFHDHSDVYLMFLRGSGVYLLGDTRREYGVGTEVRVPKSTLHGFRVTETTIILSIQSGQPISSEHGLDFRLPTEAEWPSGETV